MFYNHSICNIFDYFSRCCSISRWSSKQEVTVCMIDKEEKCEGRQRDLSFFTYDFEKQQGTEKKISCILCTCLNNDKINGEQKTEENGVLI